jgi:hypothetical protein
LRVPLETYLQGADARVYSFVVAIPYSPLDIDLGRLARGEWNALTDRFRIWYLPPDGGQTQPVCYVMVRKFDPQEGVIVYGHLVVNTETKAGTEDQRNFTVGIMSNDDIRARSALNSMLEIPPSFHRRREVRVVERRWRSDPEAVMRFLANIHSAMAQLSPSGKRHTLKFELPPDIRGELKRNLGAWWGSH